MSFLKITDPSKRDATIRDYLQTRKNIRSNLLAERVGEIETQRELSKFFKPMTETQKATAKEITEELKPIKEEIERLPKAIMFPAFPSIDISKENILKLGPITANAFRKFASKDEVDKTYGIYDKDRKFYIGEKEVEIKDNNIIVDNEECLGTPGLWELIMSKNPNRNIFNPVDYENYKKLLIQTNATQSEKNPNKPKSNKGTKWKNVVRSIWLESKKTKGRGLIVLPSDPNSLLERLDLLLASQNAGHSGVRNELVSICDELKRQWVINTNTYKKLNSIIKK